MQTPLDCFVAEPVIGPATSGRTRWLLAMTSSPVLATRFAPELLFTPTNLCLQQKGRRSADRRHPTKLRTIGCGGVPLSLSPPPLAGEVGRGRARLSALHRGTRQAGRNQHWLSSRPALPETRLLRALPVVASLEFYRAPRRPVVVPVGRGPRAARERFAKPRAGTALAPLSGSHLESTLQRASDCSVS